MSDPSRASEPRPSPPSSTPAAGGRTPASRAASDRVLCERCDAEMFRMHAVWRCPACGYKTDCCGW